MDRSKYVSLSAFEPEDEILHSGYDDVHDPLVASTGGKRPPRDRQNQERPVKWMSISLAFISIICSVILLFSLPRKTQTIYSTTSLGNLRHPNPYPNLEETYYILQSSRKSPKLIFPGSIIRASKNLPDEVFTNGSHVLLSDEDSMFYQWQMTSRPFDLCYIAAAVPRPEKLSPKTYTVSGDVGAIEIWNVIYTEPSPDVDIPRLKALSWNTRPQRLSLLGTVNFTHEKPADGWQLKRPTPRFDCPDGLYTIEVACKNCRLEFEQVFSMPALGFDLQQLG